MLSSLKELYGLLTEEQRKKLLWLQVLVILMSLAEVASVLAIGPFMTLVGNQNELNSDGLFGRLYEMSGIASQSDFLMIVAMAALAVLATATFISMFTVWRLAMYGNQVGADLSSRLYKYYMHQSWLFHVTTNSSQLTNKIAQESQRLTAGIINPLMQLNAKVVMGLVMSLAIVAYNPLVAFIGLLIFTVVYLFLYKIVRNKLSFHGRMMSNTYSERFSLMGDGFGGVKDTLLLGRQAAFTDQFTEASNKLANSLGTTQVLSQMPRYIMELLAFSSIIALVLYLLASYQGDLGSILPILSIYALAGFKLLPTFQKIYAGMALVRSNMPAFEGLRSDLRASSIKQRCPEIQPATKLLVRGKAKIVIDKISFQYPGAEHKTVSEISIELPINKVIGIVGASGSGKSTLVDILLGLIQPDTGELRLDDTVISSSNIQAWQQNLGYVAQSIFLKDTSIKQNIAFGLTDLTIDEGRIKKVAAIAYLDEFVNDLPDGLNTLVGERGVQLSGGQRQRIGIARALYRDAPILVFDEATSALDGISEKLIMDAIHSYSGTKTIVLIAHRLSTVKKCDFLYLLDSGKVIDKGSYEELISRNETFSLMVEHS